MNTMSDPYLTPAIPTTRTSGPRTDGTLVARLFRDTGYTLVQFPLAIASFVLLVTGLSLTLGLLVLIVGIPVLVAVLGLARMFAAGQRELVGLRGHGVIPPGAYRRSAARSRWSRWLTSVRTPQAWLDVLHGLLSFPAAILTFVVTTVWWSVGLAGLTYWFWEQWLPESDPADNTTLPELLGWDVSESLLYLGIGAIALVTLPPAMRLCAGLHEGLARLLLDNQRVRELEQQVRDLDAARAAASQAEVHSLRRLERDLHDGPQQRLVRLGMDLAVVERRLSTEPGAARELLGEVRQQTAETLAELRALSRGIAPPILADRGLSAALIAMAARSPVPARVDVRLPEDARLVEPVETAVYFSVSEAMANVAKHSGSTEAVVTVSTDGDDVIAEVADDGIGGAVALPGHGLSGLGDRVAALGGSLSLESPEGGGTRVVVRVPCGS